MSQITKKALAESLKSLLEKTALDKITVKDVVEDCEVNRQTFYYHFHDIYDLVDWIFTQETIKALDGKSDAVTWKDGFVRILAAMRANKNIIDNTVRSIDREQLENFMCAFARKILMGVIEDMSEGLCVPPEKKESLADFYKYPFVGTMLDWLRAGMKKEPQQLVDEVADIMEGTLKLNLEKNSRNNP